MELPEPRNLRDRDLFQSNRIEQEPLWSELHQSLHELFSLRDCHHSS